MHPSALYLLLFTIIATSSANPQDWTIYAKNIARQHMDAYLEASDHGDSALLCKLNKLRNAIPVLLSNPTFYQLTIMDAKWMGEYVEAEVLYKIGGSVEKTYILLLKKSAESPTGWTIVMFYLKEDIC
uniref:Cystatin n=1 Tax=Caenorhabditis japonica TaxID=281687 RepID=A0A8R1HYB9_CAEJA